MNRTKIILSPILPYLRLIRADAPIGYWLLLWPCWLSVALSKPPIENMPRLLLLFLLGAVVMRSSGCIFNDIIDRNYDALITRTKQRPIANGEISVTRAILLMLALGLLGFIILIQFNAITIFIGICSLPLIATYPFMKRITWWPQLWLGLTFNWGALLGWTATNGSLELPALILYAAGITWTLGYDTIYAHQDKVGDSMIGVKSAALRLGNKSKAAVSSFYFLTIVGLIVATTISNLSYTAYVGVIVGAMQLAWQVNRVDFDDPEICLTMFKSNHLFAALVFTGFLIG